MSSVKRNVIKAAALAACLTAASSSALAGFYIMEDSGEDDKLSEISMTLEKERRARVKSLKAREATQERARAAADAERYGSNARINGSDEYLHRNYRDNRGTRSLPRLSDGDINRSPRVVVKGSDRPTAVRSQQHKIKGFGRKLSMYDFGAQVMPKDWVMSCVGYECSKNVITWKADEEIFWEKVLDKGFGLINGEKRLVMVLNRAQHKVDIHVNLDANIRWVIKSSETLKGNLTRFSKKLGYSLMWHTDDPHADWETGVDMSITGTLESVFHKIFKAYAAKGVNLSFVKNNDAMIIEIKQDNSFASMYVGGK